MGRRYRRTSPPPRGKRGIDARSNPDYPQGVARQPRIEFAGAVYYLVNEGDGGEAVFRDDADRKLFLNTLGEACAKLGWEALAWRLEPARVQLLVRTPTPNLVLGMKWLMGVYTIKHNRRHRRRGHLFAGRYRSVLVEPATPYLPAACEYVHFAAKDDQAPVNLENDPWCSWRAYRQPPGERPAWLAAHRLFECLGLEDTPEGRAQWSAMMMASGSMTENPHWPALRRGWRLGSLEFRRKVLDLTVAATSDNSATGQREFARDRADLILREELEKLGWDDQDLATRPKTDAEKIRIARRLRAETAVSLRWVAVRLHMGAWNTLANSLYGRKTSAPQKTKAPGRPPRRKSNTPAASTVVAEPETSPTMMEELPVHCL